MKLGNKVKRWLAGLLALTLAVSMEVPVQLYAADTSSSDLHLTVSVYDYTAVDAELEGNSESGVIFENVEITVPQNTTVAGAIYAAADSEKVSCDLSDSGYLDAINGLGNDWTNGDGWYTSINGDYSTWELSDGDAIRADYSTENGADVNSVYDYSTNSLVGPSITSFQLADVAADLTAATLNGQGTKENPYVIPMTVDTATDLTNIQAVYESTLNDRYEKLETGEGLTDIREAADYSKPVTFCLGATVGTEKTYYTVAVNQAAICIPADTTLYVGYKNGGKHYVPFIEVEKQFSVENKDGSSACYYSLTNKSVYNYRVSGENMVTYANKFTMAAGQEAITITSDQMAGVPTEIDRDETSNKGYNVADIYLNINAKHYLKLAQEDTYQIVNLRNWEAVDSTSANYFIEPDYHYTVIDENGNESSAVVTIDEAGVVTAKGNGTAIVLVTYDAMTVYGDLYGAIWPENTGVFVVSVGAGEESLATGMTINEENTTVGKLSGAAVDAELDVFYYLAGTDGASYTFTPEEGSEVTLMQPVVTESQLTYEGGFTSEGVTAGADGAYTVCLKHGRNIVKITKDGVTEYQVLTAKEVSYQLENTTRPGEDMQAGDTVTVTFDTIYHPVNKLAGVYNMRAQMLYDASEGVTVKTTAAQYNFASNENAQTITITIPEDYTAETVVLQNGTINAFGYGDPFGNHRGITYTDGKAPNLNAAEKKAKLGSLPTLTIALHTQTVDDVITVINSIGTVTLDSKAAIEAARKAYDGLAAELKVFITNYNVLEAAEARYQVLYDAYNIKVTSIRLSTTKDTLFVGESINVTATAVPNNAYNKTLTWKSSNPSVVSISGTTLSAKKAGTATITVSAADGSGCYAVCSITVVKPTVKLNVSTLKLQVKTSTTVLKASGLKNGDSVLLYTSSNKNIVTVNKAGKLTAKAKTGTATITVKTKYGAAATVKVTVQKKKIATTALSVTKTKYTLKAGKKAQITVNRKPLNATDKITYVSSNKKIAAVSAKGMITAKKKGTCKITVKAASGKKKTITVKVK